MLHNALLFKEGKRQIGAQKEAQEKAWCSVLSFF
jgi:hypothetical protein